MREKELNFKDFIALENRKKNNRTSRPIIARFLHYGDKKIVMDQARKHLKDTDFYVYEDIPKMLYDLKKRTNEEVAKRQGKRLFADPKGRFIIADIDTGDKIMTLVNVYALNEDNPAFFRNVRDKLCSFERDFIVLGGNFDLVCDVS